MESPKHICIDLFDCLHVESMKNPESVSRFLDLIATEACMTKIGEPVVHKFPGDDSGVTGFQMLGESHASAHTYPESKCLYFDLFSCKEFDEYKILHKCIKYWGSRKYYTHNCSRQNIIESAPHHD